MYQKRWPSPAADTPGGWSANRKPSVGVTRHYAQNPFHQDAVVPGTFLPLYSFSMIGRIAVAVALLLDPPMFAQSQPADADVRDTLARFIRAFDDLDWEQFRLAFDDNAAAQWIWKWLDVCLGQSRPCKPGSCHGRSGWRSPIRHRLGELAILQTLSPQVRFDSQSCQVRHAHGCPLRMENLLPES